MDDGCYGGLPLSDMVGEDSLQLSHGLIKMHAGMLQYHSKLVSLTYLIIISRVFATKRQDPTVLQPLGQLTN